jgi:hypothetical protein
MNRLGVPQQMDLDRRRIAPVIISALLGAVMLIAVSQVFGRARAEPGAWMPRNPATGVPVPWTSRIAMTSGHTDISGAVPQMSQPLENHALPERLLVLTGIIAYTDPSQGFAIIGSSVENTYLARPGELLPDGSSIREIYPSHVVLEYGGRLETVGMYKRGEPAGAAYVQTPPLPEQARLDAVDVKGVTAGDAMPSQAPRPSAEPPSGPRLSDTRASEMTGSEHRSFDTRSTDVLPRQAQPEVPLPSAQDPANELSDDRRQQATSRRK